MHSKAPRPFPLQCCAMEERVWLRETRPNPDDFARPEQSFSRSASPNHLSTEQKTAFVISYSNVWVVCSIIRFDGARLSYALVRSNCNNLVITWPLRPLTDLSPSWPCYNYYMKCKVANIQ